MPSVGQDRSVIRGGPGGYRFAAPVRLDTARLTELSVGTGRLLDAGDTSGALAAAEQGLRLFRGEPLAGLPGPYALGERQRLLIERRSLQKQRLECLLRLGRGSEVLADLASPEAAPLLDEPVQALRIRALYGMGLRGRGARRVRGAAAAAARGVGDRAVCGPAGPARGSAPARRHGRPRRLGHHAAAPPSRTRRPPRRPPRWMPRGVPGLRRRRCRRRPGRFAP